MFSASGQTTQRPSPFNPFATNPAPAKANPFASNNSSTENPFGSSPRQGSPFDVGGDANGKQPSRNPFASHPPTAVGNGGNNQTASVFAQPNAAAQKINPFASFSGGAKTPAQIAKPSAAFPSAVAAAAAGFGPSSNPTLPTPPRASSNADLNAQQPRESSDPHAKKVYLQLRRDNISPPSWPSQPGNPNHKAEMAKFREKYEAYRAKVRASLTRAGLIDDPDQRKNLADAIDFKGICEDMCPQYEQITRITEIDVHQPEKHPSTSFPMPSRMVKKLARSAAGQEAPLPMDVRSISALKRTFDYLIDDLLQDDSNLPNLHGFLWDRTRAIRRDFTFFSSLTPEELKIQVYVLENAARFHVTALHLLSQEGKAPEDFVEQQELEQLGKALLSLRDVYDDCNEQGIICENEPEFRAYYLIFHARDPNILETLQRQWRPALWKKHDVVRTAASLVEAMQSTQDFHGPLKDGPSLAAAGSFLTYFKIVEDPSVSYTMACFAECHFPHVRRSILSAVKRGLARPKDTAKDVTAAVLNRFLRFDTVQQAVAFAELHDLEWAQDPEHPYDVSRQYLMLNNRQALPHPRLSHHFSQTLVEKKRGTRSLPDIIHQSVFEDPSTAKNTALKPVQGSSPPVVKDVPTQPSPCSALPKGPAPSFTQSVAAAPPSMFGPVKASPFAATSSNGPTAVGQVTKSPAFPTQSPSSATNPFASKMKQPEPVSTLTTSTPAASPFTLEPKAKEPQPAQSQGFSMFSTVAGAETKGQQGGLTKGILKTESAFTPTQTSTNINTSDAISESRKPSFTSPFQGSSQNEPSKPQAAALKMQFTPPTAPKPAGSTANSGPTALQTNQSLSVSKESDTVPKSTSSSAPKDLAALASTTTVSPAPAASGLQLAAQTSASNSKHDPLFSGGLLPAQTLSSTQVQSHKPGPPRDPMEDFTRWFLLGDQGLLDEFKAYIVEDMLSKLYDSFCLEQEEQQRKEEEASLLAEADAFRAYNLSMKYFYLWKDLAREKRLRTLRRQAREQARHFYEQQRAAEREARKKAADRAVREKAHAASLNRPEELMHLLKNKKLNNRQAEEVLLASGVLASAPHERKAIADIVRREMSPSIDGGTVSGRPSTRSRSGSGTASTARGGSKTRALREELFGGGPASFRRSLPPMSASARSSTEPEGLSQKSKVSERWRLKAMGITQMPDGTALPDSLANEILYGGKQYRDLGILGVGAPRSSSRRASVGDSGLADSFSMPPPRSTPAPHGRNEAGSPTKRKRSEEDEESERRRSGIEDQRENSHKRIMSGAEQVLSELRALRMEMEEGSAWFREQNERLQSEAASRATTPWEGSIS